MKMLTLITVTFAMVVAMHAPRTLAQDNNQASSSPTVREDDHAVPHQHEEGDAHEEDEEPDNHAPHEQGEDHEDHANEEGHEEHEETELHFSEALLTDFGATVANTGPGVIHQEIVLPGEVQLNQEAVAHITPRFTAKILKVMARIGDEVKAGQTLAIAESSETLAEFEIKSLIDGTVINRHITLGEVLTNADTAFVVADLSVLWVDIDLYPKHVPLVKVGQAARISTRHGPSANDNHIDYVSPLVDESTRTGLARVFLANPNGEWKPGLFVQAAISLGEFPASVVVPLGAVIDLEGTPSVFVQSGEVWEPRAVELGRRDSTTVEIVNGLSAGERYVAEGGFVLKAQLQKSEFESGHNH